MQLSQTVEYALRAIVWLAEHPDAPQTTQQIAEATKMPPSYLSKVLQALARGGLVSGQRGLHGGFSLARDQDAITLLDVLNTVEPIQRITTCPLGLEGHGSNLCALHRALDHAIGLVEKEFASQTIGDLLKRPLRNKPLCPLAESEDPLTISAPRRRADASGDKPANP